MLIFWKARLVLLAIPKTGTTALEAALGSRADATIVNPPGLKHCNVRKYRRHLAPFFEQGGRRPLDLVAVMREPVDWLGSWYRYRRRPALAGHANSTVGMDFAQFVTAHLQDDPPDFAQVGRQSRFLDGGVDHLFRHDRPRQVHDFLRDRLGAFDPPPRKNVSPAAALSLPTALEARLRRDRAEDFDIWDRLCADTGRTS